MNVMKKISSLVIVVVLVFGLVACGRSSENLELDQNEIGTQLATSVYMSTGLLEGGNETMSTSTMFLSNTNGVTLLTTSTEVEERVDLMLQYFDRVNVFIGGTPEDALSIEQTESTLEGYESQVSYELDGITYTIHYYVVDASEDDELE